MNAPLCYCLFAGLHGWEEGFVAEGFRCIGFDIEDMCAKFDKPRPNDCELIIRDVRSIHGSELKDAACIVSSSPCQEFSYRAMPWKRAKSLGPPLLGIELFNAQFRIQREACEAAGHYIPMVVENVRAAQKWVGRARWHHKSYFLWGDVPALMPFSNQETKGFKGFKDFHDCEASRKWSSRDPRRKQWSAEIAKIPFPLSSHIARCFLPIEDAAQIASRF
jgi:C-5 cytosine-specific DNA methylase